MTAPKPLFFGLYEQPNIGDGSGAASLWTHPRDQRLTSTRGFEYWLHLARIAEEINLDLFFFGDVLGIYDVYKSSPDTAIAWGVELPAHDPLMHIPALAAATRHLAFGATISTSYDHPFAHARRLSTLDHLTGGRIAWNIVTSYLPSAARNFGRDNQVGHDQRYEIAEEFLEVVYKLWEGSWADDSFVGSKTERRFADPARVRPIDHHGPHFRCAGPHVSYPSPQRTPVLLQSGWSKRGRQLGARHAEIVFAGDSSAPALRAGLADIRQQAETLGRDASDIRALVGLQIITGKTTAAARDKLETFQAAYDIDARLASYAGWSGLDLSKYRDDEPLSKERLGHTESAAEKAPVLAGDFRLQCARVETSNSMTFVGTGAEVADQIEAYAAASGTSGFLLHQYVSPGSFEDFAEYVVPELIDRGLYRADRPNGTLRSRLREDRSDRLPSTHPAARYRFAAADTQVEQGADA